jgi:hypothetical protein
MQDPPLREGEGGRRGDSVMVTEPESLRTYEDDEQVNDNKEQKALDEVFDRLGEMPQREWQRKVREFGIAASALTSAWYDLEGVDETELHINQTDGCQKCTDVSLAFDECIGQSFDEFAASLWGWIDELERVQQWIAGWRKLGYATRR